MFGGFPPKGTVRDQGSPRSEEIGATETLEYVARFSPKRADELRRTQLVEQEAQRRRQNLEWAAQFSTESERRLRSLRRQELGSGNAWPRTVPFSDKLIEGKPWDESKVRRILKGLPGAGRFTNKGGGGYGHHWQPISVTRKLKQWLSDDALKYAWGSYSGPTNRPHNYGTINGVTHHQYNIDVNKELAAFIIEHKKINGRKKLTAQQMELFINLIKDGKKVDGGDLPNVKKFNDGIKEMVRKGTTQPSKLKDVVAAGRDYQRKTSRRLLVAAPFAIGMVNDAIADQVDVLDVTANSHYYPKALDALKNGDVNKAHELLIGDRDSLFHEILTNVNAHAALNYRAAMEQVFATMASW